MKTFEEWWDMAYGTSIVPEEARLAWEAATLAERERCAEVCATLSLKFSFRGDYSLVEGWERFREQASYAIRNPRE